MYPCPKLPVPRPFQPIPRPLPQRKRMTIAVGVLAKNGLALAADSEETWGSAAKTAQMKIRLAHRMDLEGFHFAYVVGAGHGVYIDAFAQKLEAALRAPGAGKADAVAITDETLREFYAEHVIPFAAYPQA